MDELRIRWDLPDDPTKCWPWKGQAPNGRPRAKFLGKLISPRRLIYGLHNDLGLNVPRLKNTCGNDMCLNPKHMRPFEEAIQEVVPFDPDQIDWGALFKDLKINPSMNPQDIVDLTGCPLSVAEEYHEPQHQA